MARGWLRLAGNVGIQRFPNTLTPLLGDSYHRKLSHQSLRRAFTAQTYRQSG